MNIEYRPSSLAYPYTMARQRTGASTPHSLSVNRSYYKTPFNTLFTREKAKYIAAADDSGMTSERAQLRHRIYLSQTESTRRNAFKKYEPCPCARR